MFLDRQSSWSYDLYKIRKSPIFESCPVFSKLSCTDDNAVLIAAPVNANTLICSQARVRRCLFVMPHKSHDHYKMRNSNLTCISIYTSLH